MHSSNPWFSWVTNNSKVTSHRLLTRHSYVRSEVHVGSNQHHWTSTLWRLPPWLRTFPRVCGGIVLSILREMWNSVRAPSICRFCSSSIHTTHTEVSGGKLLWARSQTPSEEDQVVGWEGSRDANYFSQKFLRHSSLGPCRVACWGSERPRFQLCMYQDAGLHFPEVSAAQPHSEFSKLFACWRSASCAKDVLGPDFPRSASRVKLNPCAPSGRSVCLWARSGKLLVSQ